MKRTTKILAFVLASIFCFAAMSFGLFAASGCPDHGYQNWYTAPRSKIDGVGGIFYYHDFYCGICGRLFETENCFFNITYDCTEAPRCMWCNQTDGNVQVYGTHDFSGEWKSVSRYHYKTCQRSGCLQETTELHLYQETPNGELKCITCGYERTR